MNQSHSNGTLYPPVSSPVPQYSGNPVNGTMACYTEGMGSLSSVGQWIFQTTANSNPQFMHLLKSNKNVDGHEERIFSSFLLHLLAVIVIVVVVSRILNIIFRYLKQPRIVSQLVSGIVIFAFLPKPANKNSFGPSNRRLEYVVGSIGILLNLFMSAVKLDYSMVRQYKKKEPFIIGLASLFFPLAMAFSAYALFHPYIDHFLDGQKVDFLIFVLHPLCTTYPITQSELLAELGLLNSDIGRLAMASSMAQCMLGWSVLVVTTIAKHSRVQLIFGLKVFLGFSGLFAFIMTLFRPYTQWIIRNTPADVRVREVHIFMITLSVFTVALASDLIGFTYGDGPIIMGLALPHGPPLGTALIERVDLVASELLVPLVFMTEGFYIDWNGLLQKLGYSMIVMFIVLITFISKIAANTAAAVYCERTLKEGMLLGLMMNFRGFLEFLIFLSMVSTKLIDKATFTALLLPTIAITAISVPLVSIFYKPFLAGKNQIGRRTVQNVSPHAEFRVMACFCNDKPIPALLEFLESTSCSGSGNPMCIYTVHVVELLACLTSSLICHRNKKGFINPTQMDPVHNRFIAFEQTKKNGIMVLPFTSVTLLKTMHQDICSLVLERNVALVVVPYPKKNTMADLEDVGTVRALVPLVLEQAQCSIGIMVYHGKSTILTPQRPQYHIGVLFWGGPDDREAIAISSRIACHPSVHLSIICFLVSSKTTSQQLKNEDKGKECDENVISEFKAAHVANNHVTVSEITVENLEKASSVVLALGDKFDLLIVGKKQDHVLMKDDLEQWIESPELGVIGDMLAMDSSCEANVLIVQQHKL